MSFFVDHSATSRPLFWPLYEMIDEVHVDNSDVAVIFNGLAHFGDCVSVLVDRPAKKGVKSVQRTIYSCLLVAWE